MNNLNADPNLGQHQAHPIDPKSVPGWGVDLDPKNRPGIPREKPAGDTGAHWEEPEQQGTHVEIFCSVERPMITPVFGTTCPPQLLLSPGQLLLSFNLHLARLGCFLLGQPHREHAILIFGPYLFGIHRRG